MLLALALPVALLRWPGPKLTQAVTETGTSVSQSELVCRTCTVLCRRTRMKRGEHSAFHDGAPLFGHRCHDDAGHAKFLFEPRLDDFGVGEASYEEYGGGLAACREGIDMPLELGKDCGQRVVKEALRLGEDKAAVLIFDRQVCRA